MFSTNANVPKNVNCIRKIGEGANQEVFLCSENDKSFCVCLPKKKTPKRKWLRFSRKVMTIGHYLSDKTKVNLASGDLIYRSGEWQLHEKYIEGQPFHAKMFNELGALQQAQAIVDIATFLLDLNMSKVTIRNELFGKIETSVPWKKKVELLCDSLLHKMECYKKAWASNISKSPYLKAKHRRDIEHLLMKHKFAQAEIDRYESILKNIERNADIFKQTGPYYADIHSANLLYNKKTHTWGIVDLAGAKYNGLIYQGMARLLPVFGDEMAKQICDCYNALARQRKKDFRIDFGVLKECAIVWQAKQLINHTGNDTVKILQRILKSYPEQLYDVGVRLKPNMDQILKKLV